MTIADAPDTSAPEVAGYIVGRKLGRGGSAEVWLVETGKPGRRFALKCFHSVVPDGQELSDGVSEEDVRREIRILSVLDHQHLVKAHDVVRLGGDGRRLGILLDFAAGGSLADLVATRGRLTVGETVTVLTPMAQALAYLHSMGFTHADVSPGNVLFSAEGKPMLTDVGIARMVGDPSALAGGTPGFCDPAPVDSVRVGLQPERDLYSLAAVGWFCLTGEAPPATRDRPPLPLIHPEVPGALAAALESGLHEDRRQRPTAAEFATAVYRSAAPAAVGLSSAVHPSIIPELLTRRRLPETAPQGLRARVQAWRRRLTKPHIPSSMAQLPNRAKAGRRVGARRIFRVAAVVLAAAVLAVGAVVLAPGIIRQIQPHAGPGPTAISSTATAPEADGEGRTVGIPAGVEVQLGSADPAVAVLGLAWLRSEAFRAGEPALLDQVNVPGSAAADADARIVAGLQDSGKVLAGFVMELRGIKVQPGGTDERTVVSLELSTTAYQERTTAGDQLSERPATPAEQLDVVVERHQERWKISSILPG